MLSTTPENVNCYDEQLAKIMFGYKWGIQTNTKFSPFMIMIGHTHALGLTTTYIPWLLWLMTLLMQKTLKDT
jgi:hypothetical protein